MASAVTDHRGTPSKCDRETLPSGRIVTLVGYADPRRPWQAHRSGDFSIIRRCRRGNLSEYEEYKAGCISPLVLEAEDAQALVGLLNARVRKKKFSAIRPSPVELARLPHPQAKIETPASQVIPQSSIPPDQPWRAASLGDTWYVCRDAEGILGVAFHTSQGKPQKFDEREARKVADRLNRAGVRHLEVASGVERYR